MSKGKFVRILTICAASFGALQVSGQQTGSAPVTSYQPLAPAPQQPNPAQFEGSVTQGQAIPNSIQLSLEDAIARGLKANLGLLSSQQVDLETKATRMRTLSALLPNVTGGVSEAVQQVDLATYGFKFAPNPYVVIPQIVGPFQYADARAYASVPLVDMAQFRNYQATKQRQLAAQLSVKDARDLVVEAVGNAYLRIISSAAAVTSTEVQVKTAQVLYDRASDQKKAGTSPAIDVLRAQVELKRQQQLLLAQSNQFQKDKLTLSRVIGLPVGQSFTVIDPTLGSPLDALSVDDALTQAYQHRSDYMAAEVSVKAAEYARRAAHAQYYPTLEAAGNYGDIGTHFNDSHGTFAFVGALKFNIFDGGKIKADELAADVALTNRKNDLANLKGQVDYQVRTALLDLKASQEEVDVARSNVELSNQTLTQARDRFSAGVADNLEVVQAQQSVADADQSLISSQYRNNLARVELARALGLAEEGVRAYFNKSGGTPVPGPEAVPGPKP
jgi:outer membrane protein TolC